MKRATVTVRVEHEAEGYGFNTVYTEPGILEVTLTERCRGDLDVAHLLKRLAVMVHPKVDAPE